MLQKEPLSDCLRRTPTGIRQGSFPGKQEQEVLPWRAVAAACNPWYRLKNSRKSVLLLLIKTVT